MQNVVQKFRQSSIVFEKPGILSKNEKTLTSSATLQFNIFCRNFAHVCYLTMSTKRGLGFFQFCLDLELLINMWKNVVSTHSFLTFFINNSRSKQNKEKSRHTFVDIGKQETCVKFQQKVLNCRILGARQNFQIFR